MDVDTASSNNVVEGYAAAVLQVAKAEGDVDRVSDELFRVAQALGASQPLREALTDMRIPFERKQGIVDELLGGRASSLTVSLVNFIVGSGHGRELDEIARAVITKATHDRNRVLAEVRSSIALDEGRVAQLEEKLSQATGKEVSVKVVVDPSLGGGIVAIVGDQVFDGSVRNRFNKLREAWG